MKLPEGHNFLYYRMKNGILVNITTQNNYQSHKIERINGVNLQPTFKKDWFIVPEQTDILTVEVNGGQIAVNNRYELINKSIQGCPLLIYPDQIIPDEDGEWTGEFKGLRSLYLYLVDREEVGLVELPTFQKEYKGNIDIESLDNPINFRYRLSGKQDDYLYHNKADFLDYESIILNENNWKSAFFQIDQIISTLVPPIFWHLHPIELSSEATYRIIRQHVKDNIDSKWAFIQSDYDFTFTVSKRIKIKPYVNKSTYVPLGKRKAVTTKLLVEDRQRVLFTIGHSGHPYKDSPPIKGFRGKSLEDLKSVIDEYLTDLMAIINEPLTHCQRCDGSGIVNFNELNLNERKDIA